MFRNNATDIYKLFKDQIEDPETLYQLIEEEPKKIAVYNPPPNFHFDVMNVDEQTAISYDIMEAVQGKYT